jgi:hypothetical protein
MITSRDYCKALAVLDEKDLCEVLRTFRWVQNELSGEEVTSTRPCRWSYIHPLTRIYTERIMQLTGVGPGPAQSWRTSHQFARKAAANHAASCVLCRIHYRFPPVTPDNERKV